MSTPLRVGITRDILDSRGEPAFGRAALAILDNAPGLMWEYLPKVVPAIDADHAATYDAIYVNTARVPAAAVAREDRRLRVVARHGVGYDSVDVDAMTRAGVLVTNTPSAMPRPVATTALTFVLALAGKLFLKDRLTRAGRWHERMDHMGLGLTGRTLGVVGAGRIGKELLRMARIFDLRLIAFDPHANDVELGYLGARKVPLEDLVARSGFRRRVLPPRRNDPPPVRRTRVRADASGRVLHQRCARPGRRRAGADRGPEGQPHCGCGARRIRAGAGRSGAIRCSRWTT